jgi:hypothetical protein
MLKKAVAQFNGLRYFGRRKMKFLAPLLFGLAGLQLNAQHLQADASHGGGGGTSIEKSVIAPVEFNYIGRRAEHRQKAFVNMHGGWSMLLQRGQKGVDDANAHRSELGQGSHLGMQVAWFHPKGIGAGARVLVHRTRATTESQYLDPSSGTLLPQQMADDVMVAFVAPSLLGRLYSANEQMIFLFDLSIGRLFYRNHAVMGDAYTITGSTTGIHYGFQADRMITEQLSIGIGASHFFGNLRTLLRSDDQGTTIKPVYGNGPGLSRLDISLGLKWHW